MSSESLSSIEDILQCYRNINPELRNHLNSIYGALRAIRCSKDETEYELLLDALECSSEQLAVVVDALIEHGANQGGQAKSHELSFQLMTLFSQVASRCKHRAKPKSIKLYVEVEEPELWVCADLQKLEYALTTLSNLIVSKCPENGCVSIVSQLEDSYIKAFLSFTNPPGFNTLHSNWIEEIYPLQIAKKTMAAIGGSIKMRASQTNETEVELCCPFSLGKSAQRAHLMGIKALLVDESQVNCLVGERLLQRLGCRAITSSSGEEAIEIVKKEELDIIIIDVSMRRLSGIETARAIRVFNQNIPLLATSTCDAESTRQNCAEIGFNEFVVKPISDATIETVLRQLVTTRVWTMVS